METTPLPDQIIAEVEKVIKGKKLQIKICLAAFLSRGHLLIDDLPGVGKTMLARTLSKVLGLSYSRIQFTSDLLPSDILGVNIFDTQNAAFVFKKGPIFSQFLLADEINRASPKTQSALLEAMEERQVSVEGKAIPLPHPFFVIATKNPFEEVGTFELPGSQLDRFALSLSLGYPEHEAERKILTSHRSFAFEQLRAFDLDEIMALQEQCSEVFLSDALLDYVQDILKFTRESGLFQSGLSTRGALALTNLSRSWALLNGRDFATPDDVKTMLPYITAHRLKSRTDSSSAQKIADEILANVYPDS
jgi:MoxR-like ATPase